MNFKVLFKAIEYQSRVWQCFWKFCLVIMHVSKWYLSRAWLGLRNSVISVFVWANLKEKHKRNFMVVNKMLHNQMIIYTGLNSNLRLWAKLHVIEQCKCSFLLHSIIDITVQWFCCTSTWQAMFVEQNCSLESKQTVKISKLISCWHRQRENSKNIILDLCIIHQNKLGRVKAFIVLLISKID
jgi:hypothetical protein